MSINFFSFWKVNEARLCGAMTMAESCKEGMAAMQEDLGQKVTSSKLGASKDSSQWKLC